MPYQVSPGVLTNEIDLTTIVPAVSTTEGALAGVFRWGPLEQRVLVDSEVDLVNRFGKPTNFNPETFFTAANFLAYGNKLYVVRAANSHGTSPIVTANLVGNDSTVDVGNTQTLAPGMILIAASEESAIKLGTTISQIVNGSHIVVSSNSQVTANSEAVSLQFVSNTSVFTAVVNTATVANLTAQVVKNEDHFTTLDGLFDPDILFVARYPGALGNSLRVSVCDTSNGFTGTINLESYANGGAVISMNVSSNNATVEFTYNHSTTNSAAEEAVLDAVDAFKGDFNVTDLVLFGNSSIGTQALKITGWGSTTTSVNTTVATAQLVVNFEDELRLIDDQVLANTVTRFWEFYDLLDSAPGQSEYVRTFGNTAAMDELHLVVVDDDGMFTGVPGTVLESYRALSRAVDAKTIDGGSNYYKDVINQSSQYIYVTRDRSTAPSNTALNVASASNSQIFTSDFKYGQDGSDESSVSMAPLVNAYDFFKSGEDVDISLVLQGKARGGTAGGQLANYLIDNIAEHRKDCVVFISPDYFDTVNNVGDETDDIVDFRNTLRSTSYGFLDSGHKYMYDRYNDVYRWVPMNGDIAGLAVRTDMTNDPWWSFAGLNRGHIKNVVKLAFNPRKAHRDILYKSNINPVISSMGKGTYLFGDKTLLAKPSAFDRINVRRLFIVLAKAISTAAEYLLFEFNDEFTRAQFRNMVVPYLRDVQGRRGIIDFHVVCDETNNTPEVIDRNEFIGDIYIKPARSINFITLNFVAVRTGVAFTEVVGRW